MDVESSLAREQFGENGNRYFAKMQFCQGQSKSGHCLEGTGIRTLTKQMCTERVQFL